MATTSSCVNCKAPFPANRELATIPDASRIAFDPAHRRVWRICAKCREWNLLGTEASERALPELAARFAAAPKRAGGEGFAPAHVGSALELLQIGATIATTNESAMRRRRLQLAISKWSIPVVLLAYGASLVAIETWHYRRGELTRLGVEFLCSYAFMYMAFIVNRRRHRLAVNLWSLLPAIAMAVLGVALASTVERLWFVTPLVLGALYGAIALLAPPFSFLTARWSDGRAVHVYNRADVKRIAISWDANGEITMHGFSEAVEIRGDDALTALRQVLRRNNIIFVRRSVSAAAYDLVRTAGGLPGVLRALEGFRDDNSGRVVIADLPKVYVVALDLAIADLAADNDDARHDIAEMQTRAAEVAAEAEALDRTMKEPAPS